MEDNGNDSVTFEIGVMHCTGCSFAVEKSMTRLDGVITVNVNLTGLMALGYEIDLFESLFYSFAGIAAMIMAFHQTDRYIETKACGRTSEAITRFLTLEAKTDRITVNNYLFCCG